MRGFLSARTIQSSLLWPLVLSNFFAFRASVRGDDGNGLYKDIEIIKCLVQFINPAKFLVAIHAVMSQKFGIVCNNGGAPGIRPGERRGEGG